MDSSLNKPDQIVETHNFVNTNLDLFENILNSWNKAIGNIPVLGKILVGSKTGEGVFGVSFKIKGPPGKFETSVRDRGASEFRQSNQFA